MRVTLLFALLGTFAFAQTTHRPNVILVSLDQLGADRVHVYGNPRATTPNLDRMAAEGVRFARFYSAAPWTAPSYGSMMTSQFPSRHGVTLFLPHDVPALKPDATTLAELYQRAGYETAAFVNNGVAGRYLTARGFDFYDDGQRKPANITERAASQQYKAPAVTQRVLGWLAREHSKPFFLFVLYFEPHSPYDPPPEHDLFKNDSYPNEINTGYDRKAGRLFRLANLGDRKAIDRLWQLYDGKIHFIDSYFGQVLDKLRSSGMDKNTVVLLTSDHGELIYSHAEDYMTFDHRSLYEPVMHVPAILWGAGLPKGRTVNALATHIDIAPTLLELSGLAPKPDAQGRSLVPLVTGKRNQGAPYVFGEQDVVEPLRSVRDTRYKLILNTLTGRKQLFDTQADPAEKHDLSASQPKVLARLSAVLEAWRKDNEPPAPQLLARWREVSAQSPKIRITDEMTIGANLQLTGSPWQMDDNEKDFGGGAYWTEPARPGEPLRTARWRTDNPLLGRYRISVWRPALSQGGAAADAPYTVKTRTGEETFRVDQSRDAGDWHTLGLFTDPLWVTLTNQANGRVIVDAVRFERVD